MRQQNSHCIFFRKQAVKYKWIKLLIFWICLHKTLALQETTTIKINLRKITINFGKIIVFLVFFLVESSYVVALFFVLILLWSRITIPLFTIAPHAAFVVILLISIILVVAVEGKNSDLFIWDLGCCILY